MPSACLPNFLATPGAGPRPRGGAFRSVPGRAVYRIQEVSRDAQGNALAGVTVCLFLTGSDALVDKVVSDAAGNFAFKVPDTTTRYYAVSFSADGTLAGVTVNTLTGS